jgi:hypothetical protein
MGWKIKSGKFKIPFLEFTFSDDGSNGENTGGNEAEQHGTRSDQTSQLPKVQVENTGCMPAVVVGIFSLYMAAQLMILIEENVALLQGWTDWPAWQSAIVTVFIFFPLWAISALVVAFAISLVVAIIQGK